MNFKILDIEQNTQEWLAGRKDFLGGSDAPIIMSVSPFSTPIKLYQEKVGLSDSDSDSNNPVLRKGHVLEDMAREELEDQLGFEMPPKVIQSNVFDFARISLDGLNEKEQRVAEIKYVGRDKFEEIKKTQEVPTHYFPQVQYQLLITGYEYLDFVIITEPTLEEMLFEDKDFGIYTFEVYPVQTYQKLLVTKLQEFFTRMKTKNPPPITEKDSVLIENDFLKKQVKAYAEIDCEIKVLEERKKILRDIISKHISHPKMHYGNVKLSISGVGEKRTLRMRVSDV